jgi:hypothetical protein
MAWEKRGSQRRRREGGSNSIRVCGGWRSERERRKGIFLFLLELFYLLPFRNPSRPSATFKFGLPPERHTFPTGVTRIGDWFHGPILPRVQRHNNEMNKLVGLKLHMF